MSKEQETSTLAAFWGMIKFFLFIGLLILFVPLLMYTMSRSSGTKDKTDYNIDSCEQIYIKRDIPSLYSMLRNDDLYGEQYEKYWEAVDIYRKYTIALEWQTALENGREDADEKLAQVYEELSQLEKEAEYTQNQSLVRSLLKDYAATPAIAAESSAATMT